ncbi:MAG: PH domain-containing protein [Actinobacteria bacterium]|nr:PH domain-containing protein [Actinomycetota bacterium]
MLIPVSEMDAAHDIVSRVLPDLQASSITWVGAPRRAWWRSPLQWRNLAVGWDAHSFAIRRGRITRRTALVPHARTQSVRWTQGPWERALDLASVHVDTTPGPVSVSGLHLDASATRTVAHLQAAAADRGRRTDTSLHWASP